MTVTSNQYEETPDGTASRRGATARLAALTRRATLGAGAVLIGAVGFLMTSTPSEPAKLPQTGIEAVATALEADGPPPIATPYENRPFQVASVPDSEHLGDRLVEPFTITLRVAPGDILMKMLTAQDLSRPEAHAVVVAMAKVYSPRKLKPGHEFRLELLQPLPGDKPRVLALRFSPAVAKDVVVKRTANGFVGELVTRPLTETTVRAAGEIENSLYVAALEAKVPLPVLGRLIDIFSFDIDFQREVQPGDSFALIYGEKRDDTGALAETSPILVAEMTVRGKQRRFYRFVDKSGFADYYDATGRSIRKALLRTPVDGARISSGFGKRRHPILGYTKMHKGLDFAAPSGTPIYAAGDGVVEAAGWNGGFGRYVRIRHNGTYKTAYAHMRRIDSRIKPGRKVRQRQVIGYVGSSGRSTGPHLHYEVHKNGRQVNPRGVKLPTGKVLAKSDLAKFEDQRAALDGEFEALKPRPQIAIVPE